MVTETFAIILFLLAAFDAWLTAQRITRYGLKVELNAAIRWLASKFGPELGAFIGVAAPATAVVGVSLMFHLQWVLALLVGFRARAFFVQIESMVFEKQIKEFAASINAASSSGSHRPPSTVAPSDEVEPKQTPKPILEDKR